MVSEDGTACLIYGGGFSLKTIDPIILLLDLDRLQTSTLYQRAMFNSRVSIGTGPGH